MHRALPGLYLALLLHGTGAAAQTPAVLTGEAAYGDWHGDAPGVRRRITPADLPPPFATRSAGNAPSVDDAPAGAALHVPPGFTVARFAAGLENPRLIRVAPNGDIFVAETAAGRVRIMRAADGAATPAADEVFASGLNGPFGIAFYPARPGPALGLRRDRQQRAALRLPVRPVARRRAARDRRGAAVARRRRTLDARRAVHARRAAHAGLGRLRLERGAGPVPAQRPAACRVAGAARAGRRLGRGGGAGGRAVLRSAGRRPAQLRHRHPQLRRPGAAAHDR